MVERRHISNATKRGVRKRCGFGCVFCGRPFYEYDHVVPLSEGGTNDVDNITLLCHNHHGEKTRGLVSVEDVTAASGDPANLKVGATSPMKILSGAQTMAVQLGENEFASPGGKFVPLMVDGVPMLGVEVIDDHALLHLLLVDASNQVVLRVFRSEIMISAQAWDVTWQQNWLEVRASARDVMLRAQFDPSGALNVEQAQLYYNGVSIKIAEGVLTLAGQQLSVQGSSFRSPIGLAVGHLPEGTTGVAIHEPQPFRR